MLKRACDLLLASLVLPPMGQHALSFLLAEMLPFRGPDALEAISVVMVLVHLLVATPLALLALPGAWGLARGLPVASSALPGSVRALSVGFAAAVLLAVLARFVVALPFQALREVADVARLGLGLGCALLLQRGHASDARLLLAATAASALALLLHGAHHLLIELDHELLLGSHSVAAVLLGASLLGARKGVSVAGATARRPR